MKFFLVFFCIIFLAQPIAAQNPEWINYTYNDYIRSIVGKDDILWIETGGGLVRFNTSTEEKEFFNVCNSDLTKHSIGPKFIDSLGNLWFTFGSSSRGIIYYNSIVKYLVKFDGKEMEYFPIDMHDWEERGFSTTKIIKNKNNFFIGTWDKGLLMFDGINWTVFDTLTSEIPTNNILDIEFDENGGIWIGSSKLEGLINFNNSEWKVYDSSNSGCPNEIITDIEIDDHGKIWLTSLNKLVSFSENTWQVFENPSPEIRNIVGEPFRLDSNNEPWLIRDRLYHFSENTWQSYPIEPEIHYYQESAFYIDNYDNKWLSSNLKTLDGNMDYFKGGLSSFNNGVWNTYSLSNSKFKGFSSGSIFKDSKNSMWLSTGLILEVDGNNWKYHFPKFNGNSILSAHSFNEDAVGNIWCSTGVGLLKYDGVEWINFDMPNSNNSQSQIRDIEFDKEGNVWFITGHRNIGLGKFDGNSFTYFDTSNSNIPFSRIDNIEFDSKGNLWIGSANEGVAKYENNNWTVYKDKIKWNNVYSLYIDDEDCVWIGGFELSLYKDGVWSYYEHDDSADHYLNIILDIKKDSHNNIWVNALYGIYKFDGNKWTKFDHTNSGLPDYSVGDLEFDQHDNLWVGGAAGVILYKEGGVVTSIAESSPHNYVGNNYTLAQNYPNPFNPSTIIKYQISTSSVMLNLPNRQTGGVKQSNEIATSISSPRNDESNVTLKIYDVLGREVTTLVNQKQNPGNYEVTWSGLSASGGQVPSGVYFYQLKTDNYVKTKKMVLLQ